MRERGSRSSADLELGAPVHQGGGLLAWRGTRAGRQVPRRWFYLDPHQSRAGEQSCLGNSAPPILRRVVSRPPLLELTGAYSAYTSTNVALSLVVGVAGQSPAPIKDGHVHYVDRPRRGQGMSRLRRQPSPSPSTQDCARAGLRCDMGVGGGARKGTDQRRRRSRGQRQLLPGASRDVGRQAQRRRCV